MAFRPKYTANKKKNTKNKKLRDPLAMGPLFVWFFVLFFVCGGWLVEPRPGAPLRPSEEALLRAKGRGLRPAQRLRQALSQLPPSNRTAALRSKALHFSHFEWP